jgi:hypothetical protein
MFSLFRVKNGRLPIGSKVQVLIPLLLYEGEMSIIRMGSVILCVGLFLIDLVFKLFGPSLNLNRSVAKFARCVLFFYIVTGFPAFSLVLRYNIFIYFFMASGVVPV